MSAPPAEPLEANGPASARGWPDWWAAAGVLPRFVADLIADELANLRPGGAVLPPRPWSAELPLDGEGLGMDSLELLSVSAALSETLHMHESGIEDLLLARRTFGEWVSLAAEGLEHFSARLTFRTSGSSGQPKPCTHELVHLQQEVAYLGALLSGRRRVLTAVPAHHIYGFLFTVLLPHRLSCGPAIDLRSATPQTLRQRLQAGDLLVSHPAHWALVARHASALPAGVHGVTSTAPCPDELARALAATGLQRLLQVYGSSETAGIGWRDAPGSPFRLMPHWQRDAYDAPSLVRLATDGTRWPQPMQDRLEWLADGHFRVAGRLDGAVQVGGINVFPERVRQALLTHPGVGEAAVRPMAAHEGQRLKAFIVPAPGADPAALRDDIADWSADRLSAPERPKAFTFGTALPVNQRGKACDWPVDPGKTDLTRMSTPSDPRSD
jgi:long-chain acyl-CoA synthetase